MSQGGASRASRQRLAAAAWLACADVYLAAGLLEYAHTSVALARRNSPAPSPEVELYEGRLCEASQARSDALAHYSKALGIRHKHAPSLVRNAPPVAGNVMWARQLLRRIEVPMQRFSTNKSIMTIS